MAWFPMSIEVNIGGNLVWHCDNIGSSHTCCSDANVYLISLIHHEADREGFSLGSEVGRPYHDALQALS